MVTTSQPHVPSSRRFWVQNTDRAVQAQAGAGHPQTIAMRSHPRNLSLSASPTIMVHRGAGCASPAKKWRPAWVLNAECMIGANPPRQGRPRAMRCSWQLTYCTPVLEKKLSKQARCWKDKNTHHKNNTNLYNTNAHSTTENTNFSTMQTYTNRTKKQAYRQAKITGSLYAYRPIVPVVARH